ncbi:MAG: hypothetical protein ACRC4W_04690, partial [Treponemataceae bacterium]
MQKISHNSCYKDSIIAKNGLSVLRFTNEKTMFSRYDPIKENIAFKYPNDSGFLVVAGIGNAYHIKSIFENNPSIIIIGVELNNCALQDSLQAVDKSFFSCDQWQRFFSTTVEQLSSCIIQKYIPVLHGTIGLVFHPSWAAFNENSSSIIKNEFSKAVNTVSDDFSVQSHFGKIWQKNIFNNLYLAHRRKEQKITFP